MAAANGGFCAIPDRPRARGFLGGTVGGCVAWGQLPDARTIPPSVARLRRAHRGGLRIRSRWLVVGLWAVGLGVAFRKFAPAWTQWAHAWWNAASQGRPGPEPSAELVAAALAPLWIGVVAVVVAHGLLGSLGPISSADRRRLGPAPLRAPWIRLSVAAAAAAIGLVWVLHPFLAGAARAVDGTGPALADLWQTWFMRGTGYAGLLLLAAGALEAKAVRGARRAALHQSPEDARRDRREARRR